jgi:hypothetical protein
LRSGGYRPRGCMRCGGRMHIHEYRERVLAGDAEVSTEIALFRCADRESCGAVTRVLPALLARRLWRSWRTVEAATSADRTEQADAGAREGVSERAVAERTRRRWRARLGACAAVLVLVLGAASDAVGWFGDVVRAVGLEGARAQFVAAVTHAAPLPQPPRGLRLGAVAALVHRLAPGVRLM